MSRALNDLSPRFRPLFVEFLARCVEAGIHVLIVDTLRTPAEQAENIRKGVSWTANSKHLADESGKANAADVCPYLIYDLNGPDKLQWDGTHPIWKRIGEIGEACGMRWGGRWLKTPDPGHFELKEV